MYGNIRLNNSIQHIHFEKVPTDLSSVKVHLSQHIHFVVKNRELRRSNRGHFIGIFKKCTPISQSEILRVLTETYGNYR